MKRLWGFRALAQAQPKLKGINNICPHCAYPWETCKLPELPVAASLLARRDSVVFFAGPYSIYQFLCFLDAAYGGQAALWGRPRLDLVTFAAIFPIFSLLWPSPLYFLFFVACVLEAHWWWANPGVILSQLVKNKQGTHTCQEHEVGWAVLLVS